MFIYTSFFFLALMYAVLPFTIFLAPPLVGFLADKMGSYTRALILTLIGSGIFHTVLLFLPKVDEVEIMPSSTLFTFKGKFTNFVIDIFFRDFGSFINLFASSPWAKSFSPLRFYVRTCLLTTLKSMHSKCQLEF